MLNEHLLLIGSSERICLGELGIMKRLLRCLCLVQVLVNSRGGFNRWKLLGLSNCSPWEHTVCSLKIIISLSSSPYAYYALGEIPDYLIEICPPLPTWVCSDDVSGKVGLSHSPKWLSHHWSKKGVDQPKPASQIWPAISFCMA